MLKGSCGLRRRRLGEREAVLAMGVLHLLDEDRRVTYTILLGVWAMVAIYTMAHDQ